MLLSDWRVLLRRWYVSVVGLLVTAGLCFAAMTLVPPTYQLTAQVSLLPSTEILKGEDQVPNPYLALGGLDGIADLVSRSMSDAQNAEAVMAAGGEGKYTLELDHSSPAPLLLLTVESPTPATASKLTDLLLRRLPGNLHDLQATSGADEKAMVKSKVLTRDSKTTTQRKAQTRALVVAGSGGIMLTYLTAAVVDGVLRRRRDDPEAAPDAEDYAPAEPARPKPARPAQADVRQATAARRPAPSAPARSRPAAAKARPTPPAVEALNGVPARPAETPADGLEATLAGLLEPGDLEVPAGDARFTDDRTGSMPVIRSNGAEPDRHHGLFSGPLNGKAPNGSPVPAPAEQAGGEQEPAGEARNLVPQPSGENRPRLDEDADLPLRGGDSGLGRSRTLTSIRPRHSRPAPPPQ